MEKGQLLQFLLCLHFFSLLESNAENLKIWGNAEKPLYLKYNLQNKTWKFLE